MSLDHPVFSHPETQQPFVRTAVPTDDQRQGQALFREPADRSARDRRLAGGSASG